MGTTPPCTEGVHWFVFREWNYLSKTQWNAFKASIPTVSMVYATGNGNYRPVQPLNSRTITLRTLHIDNGGYLSAGTIAGIVIACVLAIALLIGIPASGGGALETRREVKMPKPLPNILREKQKATHSHTKKSVKTNRNDSTGS